MPAGIAARTVAPSAGSRPPLLPLIRYSSSSPGASGSSPASVVSATSRPGSSRRSASSRSASSPPLSRFESPGKMPRSSLNCQIVCAAQPAGSGPIVDAQRASQRGDVAAKSGASPVQARHQRVDV